MSAYPPPAIIPRHVPAWQIDPISLPAAQGFRVPNFVAPDYRMTGARVNTARLERLERERLERQAAMDLLARDRRRLAMGLPSDTAPIPRQAAYQGGRALDGHYIDGPVKVRVKRVRVRAAVSNDYPLSLPVKPGSAKWRIERTALHYHDRRGIVAPEIGAAMPYSAVVIAGSWCGPLAGVSVSMPLLSAREYALVTQCDTVGGCIMVLAGGAGYGLFPTRVGRDIVADLPRSGAAAAAARYSVARFSKAKPFESVGKVQFPSPRSPGGISTAIGKPTQGRGLPVNDASVQDAAGAAAAAMWVAVSRINAYWNYEAGAAISAPDLVRGGKWYRHVKRIGWRAARQCLVSDGRQGQTGRNVAGMAVADWRRVSFEGVAAAGAVAGAIERRGATWEDVVSFAQWQALDGIDTGADHDATMHLTSYGRDDAISQAKFECLVCDTLGVPPMVLLDGGLPSAKDSAGRAAAARARLIVGAVRRARLAGALDGFGNEYDGAGVCSDVWQEAASWAGFASKDSAHKSLRDGQTWDKLKAAIMALPIAASIPAPIYRRADIRENKLAGGIVRRRAVVVRLDKPPFPRGLPSNPDLARQSATSPFDLTWDTLPRKWRAQGRVKRSLALRARDWQAAKTGLLAGIERKGKAKQAQVED